MWEWAELRRFLYAWVRKNMIRQKRLWKLSYILIAISIILTATFLIFGERLLMVFGASANTIGFAMDYMRIYVLGNDILYSWFLE